MQRVDNLFLFETIHESKMSVANTKHLTQSESESMTRRSASKMDGIPPGSQAVNR
jgi:hypothetical protein